MGNIKIRKHEILQLIKNKEIRPKAGAKLLEAYNDTDDAKIAVIGISGQFPKAKNTDDFWEILSEGVDAIQQIPPNRWSLDGFYDPDPKLANKSYNKWSGMLENFDKFDPLFFNISPREAELMDPQQRLFLMEAWSALEDAGYYKEKAKNKRCGVFVGYGGGDYTSVLRDAGCDAEAFTFMGNSGAILASRIAYTLNLKGPAIALDTACSSSLVAVHLAVESILNGTSDIALAGGVMLFSTKDYHIMSSKTNMLSPTGRCHTFDERADGFTPGEAAAAVVLKSYKQAIEDGDHIYGVILGSGINQDGKTNGITAPNGESQKNLIKDVYDKYSINPESITYVEAHGTGTELGDPIELFALTDAFKLYTDKMQYCAIGSVKTNIGHTLIASGICSLIKVLLCLKNRKLVPSLHYKKANSKIQLEDSPFYVNTKFVDWYSDGTRRAAISAFGFSGTNCHMVVEEHSSKSKDINSTKKSTYIYPISAHSEKSFFNNCKALLEYINRNGDSINAGDLSYSLAVSKNHHQTRSVIISNNISILKRELIDLINGTNSPNHYGYPQKEKVNLLENKEWKYSLDKLINGEELSEEEYRKHLNAISISYVTGENIEWDKLYDKNLYCKLFLPHYIFSSNSYWVKNKTMASQEENFEKNIIHNYNPVDNHSVKLKLHKHDFFVSDHIVNEQYILPGVVLLEASYSIANKTFDRKVYGIKNVTWIHPLQIQNDEVEIEFIFNSVHDNINFICRNVEDVKEIFVQGNIEFYSDFTQPSELDLDGLKHNTFHLQGEECYKAFKKVGFQYGPSFRVIKDIYLSEKFALSYLEATKKDNCNQNYILQPDLLDGALQTVISFMHYIEPSLSQSFVPFSLKRLIYNDLLPDKCIVFVNCKQLNDNSKFKKFNIYICDESGKVVVSIEDFLAMPLKAKEQALFYETKLVEKRIEKMKADEGRYTLIFSDNMNSCDVDLDNMHTIYISYGKNIQQINRNQFTANYSESAHIRQIVNHLNAAGSINIIYIESKHDEAVNFELISLVKNLNKIYKEGENRFIYIYENTTLPFRRAFEGFFLSLEKETPNWKYRIVELETLPYKEVLNIAENEMSEYIWDSSFIKYSNNKRLTQKLISFTPSKVNKGVSIIPGATYLLTGGLGGIGYLFCNHIAKLRGNICIIGRTPRSKEISNRIMYLQEKEDITVDYFAGDIADQDFVSKTLNSIRRERGAINGVIHMAGVHDDKLLVNKNNEEFNHVINPKIWGTIVIDEETKHDKLDFFVSFSALASIFGNPGQTDYCYGNSFLFYFADYREEKQKKGERYGKSISIAWPLWRNGGMTMSKQQEEYLFNTLGMLPLDSDIGVDMFDKCLCDSRNKVAIMYGHTEKLHEKSDNVKDNKTNIYSDNSQRLSSRRDIKGILKTQISDILKIPLDYITDAKTFGAYGFDSLTFTELANSLNRDLHLEITPALFFEYDTIDSFVEYLDKNFEKNLILYKDIDLEDVPLVSEKPLYYDKNDSIEDADVVNNSSGNLYQCDFPVAIIGMSGIMPQCENLDEFWEKLENGANLVTEIPNSRWDWEKYFGNPGEDINKTNSKWGGFIKDISAFDAEFFGITPKEAQAMDPQQRLFMQSVWSVVEDAGYDITKMRKKKVGVYVGVTTSDYQELLRENNVSIEAYTALGVTHSVVANRISYMFDWKGSSEPVDTACSSSLVAIHRGIFSLKNGECEMIVAGGVNCIISPSIYISFGKAGMLSPDGKCKAFDKDANGYVRGEGVGAILMKPLEKAIEDRDHIYGIIRGSAVNHGGRNNSITSPNPNAQAEVISEAITKAGVDKSSIGYIEAHGTGTNIGDPIEITGLKRAFCIDEKKSQDIVKSCGIGSVKTNIGHLEAAAGIASVLKVLLAMKKKTLPPSINFTTLNPYISLENTPFYIVDKKIPWDKPTNERGEIMPRRAGISSFGFSGVNCHLIMEEYISPLTTVDTITENSEYLFILSANKQEVLLQYVKKMKSFLKKNSLKINLENLVFTLQAGRKACIYRLAIVFSTVDNLIEKINSFIDRKSHQQVYYGKAEEQDNILAELFDDEAGEEYLQKIIQQKDLSKLAKIWIKGAVFEWENLNVYFKPYRIPLPTYPFEQKKYWFVENNKKSDGLSSLKYLISDKGVCNEINKYTFTKELSEDDWYVSEHQIDLKKVLPGAAYIELIYEALDKIYPQKHFSIVEITWLTPVVIDAVTKSIVIDIFTENQSFTISSQLHSEIISHCQGNFEELINPTKEKVDIKKLTDKFSSELSASEHYDAAQKMGLSFGTNFRTIDKIQFESDEAIVYFKEVTNILYDSYYVPFTLIDGALQGISALNRENNKSNPLLPFYIEKIEWYKKEVLIYCAHIIKIKGAYNIVLLSRSGDVVAHIKKLVAKEVKDSSDTCMNYTVRWTEEKLDNIDHLDKEILIIKNKVSNLLAGLVKSSILSKTQANVNIIDADEESSPHLLNKIEHIYFLGGIQSADNFIEDEYKKVQEEGVLSLFRLLKKFDENVTLQRKLKLTIITNNIFQILKNDLIQPAGSPLLGFFKSALKEYSNIEGNFIDIDMKELYNLPEELVDKIVNEKCDKSTEVIGIRHNQRFRRVICPLHLSSIERTVFRKEGIYLILGGTGGIGSEIAYYLAQNYQARIALIGRREDTNQEVKEILEHIKRVGGQGLYISTDIGNYNELNNAILKIENNFGKIKGVFHSAAVLDDKLICNMNEESLKKVLWPKLNGSVELYKVLKGKDIDFILFLSSVQSFTGMSGQSNYASACTFQDSYAQYVSNREKWIVRCINWGYWGDVGMVSAREYQLRMKRYGIKPISVAEGMESIEKVLMQKKHQVIVLKEDDSILSMIGLKTPSINSNPNMDKDKNLQVTYLENKQKPLEVKSIDCLIGKDDKKSYIKSIIIDSLLKDLAMDENNIDIYKPFQDYGVDSITGVNVINSINSKLGVGIKTIALFDYTSVFDLTEYIFNEYGTNIKVVEKDVINEDSIKLILNELEQGKISIDEANKYLEERL